MFCRVHCSAPYNATGCNVSYADAPALSCCAVLCAVLQLGKAVLLEGSPGVGKTSLVSAVSRSAGVPLVRINCSEHTDMIDLLGADLPAPGGAAGQFAW